MNVTTGIEVMVESLKNAIINNQSEYVKLPELVNFKEYKNENTGNA